MVRPAPVAVVVAGTPRKEAVVVEVEVAVVVLEEEAVG
jgi:hypothetical protein